MKRWHFTTVILSFVLILSALPSKAMAWGNQNQITEVTTKRIGSDFFVELNFSRDISDKDIKMIFTDSFIDFAIPTAKVSSAKKVFTIRDNAIDKALLLRTSEGATYRLVVGQPYSGTHFQKNTSLSTQGTRLLVKIGPPDGSAVSVLSQELTEASAVPTASTGSMIDKAMKGAADEKPASVETENEQPVFKNQAVEKEKSASGMNIWSRLALTLGILGAMGFGGFYYVKKSPTGKKLLARNRMIEVVSQFPLGPKKSLAVVRVAGENILIGITETNISILKSLSLLDEDLTIAGDTTSTTATAAKPQAFEVALSSKVNPPPSEEDFTMKGLKEIVSERLKNMRSI